MAQTSNNPWFQAVPEIDEELEQLLVTSKLSVHLLENGRKSQPIEGVTLGIPQKKNICLSVHFN